MLGVIKGKSGKSKLLAEQLIGNGDIIIDACDAIHKMISADVACEIISIPSNEKEELETILNVLTDFFKETNAHKKHRIIFYVNTTEDNIQMFVDFSNKFKMKKNLLTVQADNEELKFYGFK
ncbi:TPA: hypothetical protein QC364_000730 [Bacillus cereus]|nr:hypothetical protein [Bacillus cereus]